MSGEDARDVARLDICTGFGVEDERDGVAGCEVAGKEGVVAVVETRVTLV
jgi:hypothetical protein